MKELSTLSTPPYRKTGRPKVRNKFPGQCFRCQVPVAKGQGHPEKVQREHFMLGFKTNFVIRCKHCVGKGIEILPPNRKLKKKH